MRCWSVGICLLFVISQLRAAEPSFVPVDQGLPVAKPAQVSVETRTNADLQVRISWPDKEGAFPLICWTHGMGGNKDNYRPLVDHWVAHGYIVFQATHGDSLQNGRQSVAAMKNFWDERVEEVNHLIDHAEAILERVDRCPCTISSIGVGGHSFGAHTSAIIAGAKPIGLRQEFHNERSLCAYLVSPPGPKAFLGSKSLAAIGSPSLVLTGTNDRSVVSQDTYEDRRAVYEAMPAGDKYLVVISEAYHGFGGITGTKRFPGSGPDDQRHVDLVRLAGLALFDAYLKESAAAKEFLQQERLRQASIGVETGGK